MCALDFSACGKNLKPASSLGHGSQLTISGSNSRRRAFASSENDDVLRKTACPALCPRDVAESAARETTFSVL